jgi:outer membrane protein, heavy metal efflux system
VQWLVVTCVLVALSPSVRRDAVTAITFDEALALSAHTEAARTRAETVENRRGADRRIPRVTQNPQLNLQPGVRLRPQDERGFAWQAQLTQSWNLRDAGRARRDAMRAETQALSADFGRRALLQRLDAARAWVDLRATEQVVALTREERLLAQRLLGHTQAAYEARVLTRAELAEARRFVAEVEVRQVQLEGRVYELGLQLAASAGLDPTTPVATRGPTPNPTLPEQAVLARQLSSARELPQVVAARLESTAARARAVEARANRGTQLTVGASAMQDGPRELVVQGVVGISIPAFDRGQAETSRARTAAGLAEADAEQADRALRSELAQIVHDLHHTKQMHRRLETELVPTLTDLVQAREALRAVGEVAVFEVVRARRQLFDARTSLARAEAELSWAELVVWLYLAELEHALAETR